MGVNHLPRGAGVMGRSLNARNGPPIGQIVNISSEVAPGFSIIPGEMHQTIVGACPEQALLSGRFSQGEDGAIELGGGVVAGDGSA